MAGTSLRTLYEEQWAGHDDGLAKQAAAHGMSTERYIQAVAAEAARQEEMQKQAAENDYAEGLLIADGFRQGINMVFSKLAAQGGDVNSCGLLANIFIENR